jgi:predicted aconitase with swiveling domain
VVGGILGVAMAKVRIQEVRKLLFSIETAVDAVLELDRSHGGTLANGKVAEVRVESGSAPGLTLVVMQGSGASAAAIQKHYTLPAVAAAAIHYCFRVRIPLPRQGTKSIEVVADGFQLTINTNTELLRLHGDVAAPEGEPIVATGDAALDDPTSPEPEPEPVPEVAATAAA